MDKIAVLIPCYNESRTVAKVVADFNLWVCLLLMLALFLVGPTLPIVNSLMTGVGDYLSGLVKESFTLALVLLLPEMVSVSE